MADTLLDRPLEYRQFTTEQFLAWAKTKPAEGQYDYCLPWACPIAQFCKETDRFDRPMVDSKFVDEELPDKSFDYSARVYIPAWLDNAISIHESYGELVTYLEGCSRAE